MALLDGLQKGLYFAAFALHLQLDPAVDQVLNPASDFVAPRHILDTEAEPDALNPAFVNDALGDHQGFEFRVSSLGFRVPQV
jgi:hypothetical protein